MLTASTLARIILPLVLLLGGCAGGGSCAVEKWADLPLLQARMLPLVPVSINGRPAAMVLDTGAQRTMLGAEAAARLGVLGDGRERTRVMTGIGGSSIDREIRVESFMFGNIRAREMSVLVAPLALPVIDGIPIDGLLGADVLAPLDVEVDLPHRRVGLYRSRACAAGPPWADRYATLAAVRSENNTLILPVTLDGRPQRAVLDTGTVLSTVSLASALRGGIDAMALRTDPIVVVRGANAGVSSHRLHRFAELGVGEDNLAGPTLVVTDSSGALAKDRWDMLLGMDYIARKKLWLSYATNRVFVTPPVGAMVPR